MKPTSLLVLAAVFAGAAVACGPAHSKSPGTRRLMDEAASALKEGHLVEAARDYDEVLAIALPTDSRRPEALYWAGLLRLEPEPGLRDMAHARKLLEELADKYPAFPRLREANIALALADELAASEAETERISAETARAIAACAGEKEEIGVQLEAAQADAKSARDKERDLKAKLNEAQAQVQKLNEDVKAKEDALRKVKEVLVDWKPKR